MKLGLNLYRVTRATGLRVKRISDDWLEWDLELRLTLRNRNFVGTHFGGSLYAGADPQFMLAFLHILPDLVVWDKAATIRFRRPSRGTVRARFHLPAEEILAVRRAADAAGKVERVYAVEVVDEDGEVIAEVEKTLHVRRRDPGGAGGR